MLLLTWTVEPEPVDAGIPPAIQTVLAEALCALGPCWFPGDEGSGSPVATVGLARAFSLRRAFVFRADRAADLRGAFDSGAHDWSMAAQWIVVSGRDRASDDRIVDLLRALLEDWEVPGSWPEDVLVIIQAGVDGDAAGCHCRTPDVQRDLCDALQRSATTHGVVFRIDDAGPPRHRGYFPTSQT